MKTQNLNKLKKVVSNFNDKKILVIGDVMLDEFIWGEVSRISPEAPVPVVWVKKESFMPGGAANVANNIISLGAQAHIVGLIGEDVKGAIIKNELELKKINTDGLISDPGMPTIVKTRVVAHQQQVVRIDREVLKEVPGNIVKKIVAYVQSVIKDMDAVIIEDYGKGLITPALLRPITALAKKHKKLIAVDPKEEHLAFYKGATVITPNHHEASKVTGLKIKDKDSIDKMGHLLVKKLDLKYALITLGENGMAIFEKGKKAKTIPTIAQEVYDVSGAGDTVISTFTLCLAAGATPIQATHISNCAAGIVVGKVGISVVDPEELIERMRKEIEN
ncbi:MAG: D-glycero-beta-D-manno-heptose-7-phosphate kinase [Candidatus Omnitrophica bacterium]|nr:D-glycero-beta-D-manno-heptose-7-phosphate kinase [Candidatus Omnitrophota bacterium]